MGVIAFLAIKKPPDQQIQHVHDSPQAIGPWKMRLRQSWKKAAASLRIDDARTEAILREQHYLDSGAGGEELNYNDMTFNAEDSVRNWLRAGDRRIHAAAWSQHLHCFRERAVMPSLPGWDSIESVGAIGKALPCCRAGRHRSPRATLRGSGVRFTTITKTFWSPQPQHWRARPARARDAESKKQLDAATGQIEAAHKEAHDAQTEVVKMKEAALPRHLTEKEKSDLARFLGRQAEGGNSRSKPTATQRMAAPMRTKIAAFFK